MTRFGLGFAISLCAGLSGAADAQDANLRYMHNGSVMAVTTRGDQVTIRYQTPRAGLHSVGVSSGTVLFRGAVTDGYLDGMSNIFSAACGAIDYFVYGDFTAGAAFTLRGAAPVLAQSGCQIVDNTNTGSNASLVFTPQQQTGCLQGVNTMLNVRVGPAPDYGIIAQLPAATCDINQVGRCDGAWCAISAGTVMGWVHGRYLAR